MGVRKVVRAIGLRGLLTLSAILAFSILFSRYRRISEEKERLEENFYAMASRCDTLRTVNGSIMADCRRLVAERDELRENFAEAVGRIEAAGVRLKYAESVSISHQAQRIDTVVVVRDTVIYRDTSAPMSAKAIEFRDPWTDVRGIVGDSSATLSIASRDTITQVVYRVPRKFLFFRFGTKAIRQRVTGSNPHNKIFYTEYIEIK